MLTVSSLLILQARAEAPDANITTGGDALWWGLVTITTVGYGDYYPVTMMGRLVGISVMFAGVGIIGALASILASMLVPPPKDPGPQPEPAAAVASPDAIVEELAKLRAEIAELRETVAADRT